MHSFRDAAALNVPTITNKIGVSLKETQPAFILTIANVASCMVCHDIVVSRTYRSPFSVLQTRAGSLERIDAQSLIIKTNR